ncbi:Uncharacterised protein [Yersinia pekkanenii]|uniref:Uncharacterized protein n=1 Tax=Yersinia pekkanenii TaxID=1288385 RepID=A0ABP1ZX64_9GAMM|nr:Uncharacterised protein [Yersinia pekkanenii]
MTGFVVAKNGGDKEVFIFQNHRRCGVSPVHPNSVQTFTLPPFQCFKPTGCGGGLTIFGGF